GDRPFQPRGDRPQGDRPFQPRGDRPQGDRPYQPRPQGDRPYPPRGDRPVFDKDKDAAPQQRPQGNRPPKRSGDAIPPPMVAAEKPSNYRPATKKTAVKDLAAEKDNDMDMRSKNFRGKPGKKDKGRKEAKAVMPPVVVKKITIGESVILGDLAKAMGKTAGEVIKKLFAMGIMATINQEIDSDTAILVADDFGITVEVRADRAAEILEDVEDESGTLVERPPVVTIMGHVDHGKTSLLDAIRHTSVTSTEAGGITQHIGAYQVEINGKKITFLDTPGHEAFTAMRARGAQITDICIIVVAADDGVMPQTVEAINHAKAAGVPIIVAINKIDKPTANPDHVKQELSNYGLISEEWGGETIMVPVSAKARMGIENLLEMILLVAEVGELKANPDRAARGTVIEAQLDKNRGPVATLLVQKGTLHAGDMVLAGAVFGKVRAMTDDKGRKVRVALPSTPVEILGLSEVPPPGEIFIAVEDEKDAKMVAYKQQLKRREEELRKSSRVSLDDLFSKIAEGEIKDLNLVVKGDVQGSVEALKDSLLKLSTSEVKVNVIHSGVGGVSESDVMLATASNAIIIGFNVVAAAAARTAADKENVDIRLYRVIYDTIEDVKKAMSGLLAPEFKEVVIGRAQVRQVFKVPKAGMVAGSYVQDGKVSRVAQVRVIRNDVIVAEDKVDSLRRFKDDVKEVATGFECGIGLENFNDIKEGDIFEFFVMEEIKREI
ncbi:MAG: translation initiation factor IF-2, partial [Firmicutes bacterium]|nr:translation initiation factor IF-2 [Bacillota bacterium]